MKELMTNSGRTTMFSRFSELPHDLQKAILSYSPSILSRSLRLDKRCYNLMLPIALQTLGEKEIDEDEYGWFLNDNPISLKNVILRVLVYQH